MKPAGGVWRKNGRRPRRRASEPHIYPPALATSRQRAASAIAELEHAVAWAAHYAEHGNSLPGLIADIPGVTIVIIEEAPDL